MGVFSNTWRAVTGKISESGVWSRYRPYSLFEDKAIDYTRNDYDLYESIYYGVSIAGKAQDMTMGAMFAKPIVNSTVGFMLGTGFSIKLDGQDKSEQAINDWINENFSTIQQFVLHGVRGGDSYLYIDEYGNPEELDPNTVTVVLDPMSGTLIGYDVEEKYTLQTPEGQKTNYVVVKNYRTDSVKYTRYLDNATDRKNGEILYHIVYTTEGTKQVTSEKEELYTGDIQNRPLPIIHYANDPEARAVYGNSELLNCLVAMRNYTAIVANATKGVINSSNPIPVMLGVKNADAVAKQSNKGETEDTDRIDWSPDSILFLENNDSDAKYIQPNSFMDDAGKLLEYYFYLIVEGSETPEFVFGTAVSSSKASVSEQFPIVVQKSIRKRNQLKGVIQAMVESLIDRNIRMSNTDYLPLKNKEYAITVVFPEIETDDKRLTLETVKYLLTEGIITKQTALELLLEAKIDDPKTELEAAQKELDEEKAQQPNPFDKNRIENELNGQKGNNQDNNNPQDSNPQGDNPKNNTHSRRKQLQTKRQQRA